MYQGNLNSWEIPPAVLPFSEKEVHVWRVSLELLPDELAKSADLLSKDEKERATRFRFEHDQDCFVARRGLLRVILGRYLEIPPQKVEFTYNSFGKPAVSNTSARVRFNLSHSSGLALVALSQGEQIGVDLERLRNDVDIEQISDGLFSEIERSTLRSLPPKVREQAFFCCWTRKEAYLKARGEGLSIPLSQFSVTVLPDETPRLIGTQNDPGENELWTLYHLSPGSEYIAAIAVEGKGHQVRLWTEENLL